jgi:hypothetical protein
MLRSRTRTDGEQCSYADGVRPLGLNTEVDQEGLEACEEEKQL